MKPINAKSMNMKSTHAKLTNDKPTSTPFSSWKRIAAPLFSVVVGGLFAANIAQAQPVDITPEERQQFEERLQNMSPEQRQQIEERLRNMNPEQLQQLVERYRSMSPEQRQQFEERFAQPRGGRGGERGGGRGRGGRGEGRGEGGGEGNGGDWRQAIEINPEDRQKYLMRSAGIEDVKVQNAIIAFVAEQAKQRQGVTEAAAGLSALLADKKAAPAAISAALENLTLASKAFREWKQGALAALDTNISYSKDPRLKSLLVLVGIIGEEAGDAGGFNAIFPKGVAGSGDIMDLVPRGGGRGGRGGWGGRNRQPGEPAGPEG